MNYNQSQSERHRLSVEIVEDVRQVFVQELADAPRTLTDEARKAIEDEMIGRTERLLEALTLEEMKSAGAQARHLANVRTDIQHLIYNRRKQSE
jgi:hypothetical protein